MIKSMTGFGRGESGDEKAPFEVEIRGVNHRFLEVRFRLPPELSARETELRSRVSARARRGRVEVSVNRGAGKEPEASVSVNRELVARYLEAARAVAAEFKIPGKLSLESILGLPGAIRMELPREVAGERENSALLRALDLALETFEAARVAEGARLRQDLISHLEAIQADLEGIARISEEVTRDYEEKIRRKLRSLLESAPLDEGRLMQEAAYLATRSDITEEVVRLQAHLRQARQTLDTPDGPVGKSLDFLVQEMHRETNTIGAKAESLAIAQAVLRVKGEVEKVREQVQNLE